MPAFRSWCLSVLLLPGLPGATGCGGNQAAAAGPDPSLSPYTPEAAVLFDDVLAPAVFGFDPEGRNPARDPKLRERVLHAEFIVPARVETVSRVGGVAHTGAYEITLAPSGPPLVGALGDTPLVLNVPVTNPSYSWVDGAGARWVGARVVLFARHYRNGGTAELHFRCEPDIPEVRASVERDAGLRLLR